MAAFFMMELFQEEFDLIRQLPFRQVTADSSLGNSGQNPPSTAALR
jgi:hypothetical protein